MTDLAARLTDGEWHRLHPATPFLRGGLTLVAIVGVVLVQFRDVFVNVALGGPEGEGEPFLWVARQGFGGLVALGIIVLVALLVAGFYASWRMHSFRITDEVVEVRSGILFRSHRRARLDRVQGINIQRPFLARLVGAARLEVNVAGQDANVKLEYLASVAADDVRLEILRLASGAGVPASPTPGAAPPAAAIAPPRGLVEQRVGELLAPELHPDLAAPESVVHIHPRRLLGSIVLSGTMLWLVAFTVGPILLVQLTGLAYPLVAMIPGLIGVGSALARRFTKSLRYSIAATPDGIRVGYGLFSTTNETLPPGRIHAIQVEQPIVWRPAGWWQVRIDRASSSGTQGAAGQANTTILPVGTLDDVRRVLGLILPALMDADAAAVVESGLTSGGGFTVSPPRARVLRWFSLTRNGFAHVAGVALFRRGAIWRSLTIVPLARVQGVSLHEGPIERRLRLASVHAHTVAGPVTASIGAIDTADAAALFDALAVDAVASAQRDTAHRWRSGASTVGSSTAASSGVGSSTAGSSTAGSSTAPTSAGGADA